MSLPIQVAAGQLIVGGFHGRTLSETFAEALARGERGGAILFRRNVGDTMAEVATLNRTIALACPRDLPPVIGVDQEGGRVTRLGAPVLRLPSMRALGSHGDSGLVERAGRALGQELAALGFTLNFAPVLDVDTCATNPIIGDRSFSSDARIVASLGAAFARGLHAGGIMACGKHFPGHGDTTVDSHLDLPRVAQPRDRLDAVELLPFRGLSAAGCAALMTAHVIYDAVDSEQPATLSRAIATTLLRDELRYDGLLISDDLEMKAIADRLPIEASAVLAVRAGCDVLLICSSEELQARAHAALVREAELDSTFRDRVHAAAARGIAARRANRNASKPDASLVPTTAAMSLSQELVDLGLAP